MTVDKKINYEIQGGVKNYLGKQKEVKAPIKWKSSPDHPETELAYITKAEKDLLIKKDLHGSLKGGVNRGPSGIISLNGFGSRDSSQNVGGGDISSAETGGGRSGMSQSDADDFRSAAIAAGAGQRVNPGFFDSRNVVSPAELARAKAFNPAAFRGGRRGGIMDFFTGGGLLGNIIRGLGQKLGLGKRFNEPTYDMRGNTTLDIRDKYDRRIDDEDEDADALASRLNEFGLSPDFTTSLINEFGQSPNFTTSLINEFGVKDRGVVDANLGLESIMPNRVGPENTGFIERLETPQSRDNFFLDALADATYNQQKNILENVLNTEDTGLEESIEQKEKREDRQQELLNEILTG